MKTEFQDFIKDKNRELYNLILEDLSYGHLELFRLIEQYSNQSKWISVEDRLPENETEVIVCDDETVSSAYLFDGKFYRIDTDGEPIIVQDIINWQPFPEAP